MTTNLNSMHLEMGVNPEYTDRYTTSVESSVVQKALSGDTAAFARMCCAYVNQIYTYIYYQVKDQNATGELVTEIFLEAYKKIQTYKDSQDFLLWLYRIAHDYLATDPRFFSSIPFPERQTVILKFLLGLNNQEVAWVTGQKTSLIKMLQAQALSNLKHTGNKASIKLSRSFCETLDNCFLRISSGESIERCLFQNARIRNQLEPLLLLGLSIARHPKVKPDINFKVNLFKILETRFQRLSRQFADIRQPKVQIVSQQPQTSAKQEVAEEPVEIEAGTPGIMSKLFLTIKSSRILSISIAAMVVAIVAISLLLSGVLQKFASSGASGMDCMLEVISGTVSIQNPGEDKWQTITGEVNTPDSARIKTGSTARASLTCPDGSKIVLTSDTEIEILNAKYNDEAGSAVTEIKQYSGKITSKVNEQLNTGSHFSIDTPAALVTVIGTEFTTEITPDSSTQISVIKGTVKVKANGKEVLVKAGYQLTVEMGASPGEPIPISSPEKTNPPDATPGSIPLSNVKYTLQVESTTGGRVILPVEVTGEYDENSEIKLVALADSGYAFSGWTGDIDYIHDIHAADTYLTIRDNCVITANFVRTYTLTIRTLGGSIDLPGDSTHEYPAGTVVQLSVKPDNGYEFLNWTGSTSTIADTTSPETTITLNRDCDITANFVRVYKLTVTEPKGGWIIKPGTGSFTYHDGAQVEVLAIPDTGYVFAGWTCAGNDILSPESPSTKITINRDSTLTAKFILPVVLSTLSVNSGHGGKVIKPEEGTFTCKKGAVIELEAVPNKGYGFLKWIGDTGSIENISSPKTSIVVSGNYSITAVFVPAFDLTVNTSAGGIILQPGGITYTYNTGTIVPLKAIPIEGYRFVNWTGDVSTVADPQSAVTTITIIQDATITANFVRDYTLTVSTSGGGTVIQPGCGLFYFSEGSVVDLIAVADSGYTFYGWEISDGSLSYPSSPSISITIQRDTSVTARFIPVNQN